MYVCVCICGDRPEKWPSMSLLLGHHTSCWVCVCAPEHLPFKKQLLLCRCVWCTYGGSMHTWEPEGNFWELVLFLPYWAREYLVCTCYALQASWSEDFWMIFLCVAPISWESWTTDAHTAPTFLYKYLMSHLTSPLPWFFFKTGSLNEPESYGLARLAGKEV